MDLQMRFLKITEKQKQKVMIKKLKIILNLDPHWKNKDLEFRAIYYIGKLGFEITINDFNFLTEKVINVLNKYYKIGTIGNGYAKTFMITIWENDKND